MCNVIPVRCKSNSSIYYLKMLTIMTLNQMAIILLNKTPELIDLHPVTLM